MSWAEVKKINSDLSTPLNIAGLINHVDLIGSAFQVVGGSDAMKDLFNAEALYSHSLALSVIGTSFWDYADTATVDLGSFVDGVFLHTSDSGITSADTWSELITAILDYVSINGIFDTIDHLDAILEFDSTGSGLADEILVVYGQSTGFWDYVESASSGVGTLLDISFFKTSDSALLASDTIDESYVALDNYISVNGVFDTIPSFDASLAYASSDTQGIMSTYNIDVGSGQEAFTTIGAHTFLKSLGMQNVCAVAVGGGGNGVKGVYLPTYSGGSGGGLGWANDISLVAGKYDVVVGGSASDSYFVDALTVLGGGGLNYGSGIRVGGTYVGDGGGNGGSTNRSLVGVCGGGGAGGYSGNGGTSGSSTNGGSGAGGGGGGGGGASGTSGGAGAGGGVGIYGEGTSGSGGSYSGTLGYGGAGGSGGGTGANGDVYDGSAGSYGGGGSCGLNNPYKGGQGAVRIIWGTGRAFPSTNTADI